MKYNLRTQHITLTDLDQSMIDEKLEKLKKHLHPPFMIDLSFEHDTHHRKGDVVTCKVTVEQGKKVYHADRIADSVQTALDQTIGAIQKELEKEHDKRKKRHE